MKRALRIMMLEDSEDDAELLLRHLKRSEYEIHAERFQSAEGMRAALERQPWDVILSDYSMPEFGANDALRVLAASGLDIPFIIISGTIGEETAVDALKSGAHDFLVKGRLVRLFPAIERAIRDAETRRRRQEAERDLRSSEERFRTLVESMDDFVFTLDRDQRYDGLFGRWLEREGFSPRDFLGKKVSEVRSEPAVHEAANARALAGEHAVYEWSQESPNGTRYFHTSLSPRRGEKGEVVGIVGVGREITEQKRVHAQLVTSDRMASVGMMAAGVAHEINNPLASVVANLDLATRDVSELMRELGGSPKVQELVEELRDAREAAERIRSIVRDLKLFSRAEEEKRGPVDVHRVLESCVRMAWNEIRHRAKLATTYGAIPLVDANDSRLGQVFLNLIVNAAQAIPEGHADANQIRIVTLLSAEQRVIVEVHDTGSGMSPEVVRRLFTPFYTTKPVGVGTGLGLSICHRIVTSMGGTISVQSEVGKGTTFKVELLPSQTAAEVAPVAQRPMVATSRRGRVLVVDDEPAIATAVRRCLSRDHDVTVSSSAIDALSKFDDGARFDVILCDLMMPEMSGMDLYAELAKKVPNQAARMIFLTGGAFTPRTREFLDEVPNMRLEKPFDTATLRAIVNDRVGAEKA